MLFNLIRSTYSLTSRKYLKQSITLSRHISLFDRLTGKQKNIILYNRENHKVIYRFNYISLVSGIIRAKYYLPIATVFIFPILLIQDSSGALPIAFIIANVLQYVIFEILSKFTHNMIGMVFVNKTGDVNEVIISALGESGNRIEKLHQPENVVIDGFSNKGSEVIGFISVGVKNSDISYKLNIRNCKVFDDKSFKLIFGNIKTYS